MSHGGMQWNWDVANTIVFSWWKTTSTLGLFMSAVAIVAISLSYEFLAGYQRFLNQSAWPQGRTFPSHGDEPDATVTIRGPSQGIRALFYGLRTFMGILLMLIMMTFNGFFIFAIIMGAILGHYLMGRAAGCQYCN